MEKKTAKTQTLLERLDDTIDGVLDIAVTLARDDDDGDELVSIERVRAYLHACLEGRPLEIDKNDVLTTLAILMIAIELDFGIDSSRIVAVLRSLPSKLQFPGVAGDLRASKHSVEHD